MATAKLRKRAAGLAARRVVIGEGLSYEVLVYRQLYARAPDLGRGAKGGIRYCVIPANAGIQSWASGRYVLDSSVRWNDGFQLLFIEVEFGGTSPCCDQLFMICSFYETRVGLHSSV